MGAAENNLKNVHTRIPVGCFTCVTGVSGSGKSTLINDILSRVLFRHFYQAKERPGAHERVEGIQHFDKVVTIDQSAIGRTPRSNPATYVGAFDAIRDLFAQLPASRIRGYAKGRFSFNTAGGRCEHCEGDGSKKSRCISCRMFMFPAKSAKENASIAKPWKSPSKVKISRTCSR
ncbi:MAG: hypothetical protein HC828_10275 [Blastochloris sp.]|nr:hypothetical protein [Blastochloris sp.]